ncbi:MAG: DUF5915 domain-containing protein, partial [Egibacteraceae bacterium]
VRQPVRRAVVTLPPESRHLLEAVREVIAAELNVKAVEVASDDAAMVSLALKANFRALGPSFGSRTKAVAAAIQQADARAAVASLRDQGRFTVSVDGEILTVTDEQVQVIEEPVTGWQVSTDGPYSVALDLAVDRDLRLEGLARDFVRVLNDLRKRRGLDFGDRIALYIAVEEDPDGDLAAMLDTHGDAIARDILAVAVSSEPGHPEPVQLGDGRILVDVEVV